MIDIYNYINEFWCFILLWVTKCLHTYNVVFKVGFVFTFYCIDAMLYCLCLQQLQIADNSQQLSLNTEFK